VTILCYHAVDPTWRSPLAVRPEEFDAQIGWLASKFDVLPLDQAAARLDRRYRLPKGVAAITFDDGFRSVLDHALPVLRRHGVPATVFVVAETLTPEGRAVDWVDTPPPEPLQTLTLDEVRELEDAGVSIGSHSYSHRVLTSLSEAECEADLRRSRELLEDLLGHEVPFLAYPRGFHDDKVRRAAAAAGFRNSFTLPEDREDVGPQAVPRVGIYPGNGVRSMRLKTDRRYLRFRAGRAYPWIRMALRGSRPPQRRAG
jgi:peptidoglycan/xylan/chitin deacetylase (PgdA/CDA1 family)